MPIAERVAWDSDVVIALLAQEPPRYRVLKHAVGRAEAHELEIVVSALCLCEVGVLHTPDPQDDAERMILGFFEQPWTIVRQVDSFVGARARELIRQHGLKGADAAHVAAAMLTPGVSEFWTYDKDLRSKCSALAAQGLPVCEPRWRDDQPALDLDE